MSEESKSELYARHQGLFDGRFAEIMIRTFPGFDRARFDQLAENDPEEAELAVVNITWYEEENEDLPEGTSRYWSDGTPLPEEGFTDE